MEWRETYPPTSLFKTATAISLTGVVSYSVVASIFNSIDLAKLRHLKLDNLQVYAEQPDVLQSLSSEENETHSRDRAGPLQGWFQKFTGKCTLLRSFHFSTVAEFVDKSGSRNRNLAREWNETVPIEHRRYAELGAFIASVKPTLREFSFEHGPVSQYFGQSVGRTSEPAFAGPNHDIPLPMDVLFDQHVLPAIISGPWPCLQSFTVKGIGHWKPLDPWKEEATPGEIRYLHSKTVAFRDRAEMIWDAVKVNERHVEFIVEDSASRPFYSLRSDHRRSATGI